jgi:hypothetical protein
LYGSGKRLFRDGNPVIGLRLAGTKTFSGGVVAPTYEPVSVGPGDSGVAVAGGASE